jgi:hypothetical protein
MDNWNKYFKKDPEPVTYPRVEPIPVPAPAPYKAKGTWVPKAQFYEFMDAESGTLIVVDCDWKRAEEQWPEPWSPYDYDVFRTGYVKDTLVKLTFPRYRANLYKSEDDFFTDTIQCINVYGFHVAPNYIPKQPPYRFEGTWQSKMDPALGYNILVPVVFSRVYYQWDEESKSLKLVHAVEGDDKYDQFVDTLGLTHDSTVLIKVLSFINFNIETMLALPQVNTAFRNIMERPSIWCAALLHHWGAVALGLLDTPTVEEPFRIHPFLQRMLDSPSLTLQATHRGQHYVKRLVEFMFRISKSPFGALQKRPVIRTNKDFDFEEIRWVQQAKTDVGSTWRDFSNQTDAGYLVCFWQCGPIIYFLLNKYAPDRPPGSDEIVSKSGSYLCYYDAMTTSPFGIDQNREPRKNLLPSDWRLRYLQSDMNGFVAVVTGSLRDTELVYIRFSALKESRGLGPLIFTPLQKLSGAAVPRQQLIGIEQIILTPSFITWGTNEYSTRVNEDTGAHRIYRVDDYPKAQILRALEPSKFLVRLSPEGPHVIWNLLHNPQSPEFSTRLDSVPKAPPTVPNPFLNNLLCHVNPSLQVFSYAWMLKWKGKLFLWFRQPLNPSFKLVSESLCAECSVLTTQMDARLGYSFCKKECQKSWYEKIRGTPK